MKLSFFKETVPVGTEPITNYCLLETVTPPLSYQIKANLDLVLVIDLSSFMQAKNIIKSLKKALEEIIAGLNPEDRISLVAFGSDAVEVFTLLKGNNKKFMREKIRKLASIDVGPTTVLFSGMQAAYNIFINSTGSNIKRMILVTGGESTEPEYKCRDLGKFFQRYGIQIKCIGIGSFWNMHLLNELDWRHEAVYIRKEEIEQIPEKVVNEFKAFLNTYATDVVLQFKLAEGMQIKKLIRFYPRISRVDQEAGTYNFKLGSLIANTKEYFLFQMLLPPRAHEVIFTLGKYKLIYNDPLSGMKNETPLRNINVSYSRDGALTSKINPEMLYYLKQQSTHTLVERAIGRITSGDIHLGLTLLEKAAQLSAELGKTDLQGLLQEVRLSVQKTGVLSSEQKKDISYGTRQTSIITHS